MKTKNERPQENGELGGKASPERDDWISKYLDLADKAIRTHMPAPGKQGSGD